MKEYLVLFFAVILCVTDASKVPFINKCKVEDSQCLVKSTQSAIPTFSAGIPELGISPLEPLLVKSIDASTGNLKFILNDVVIKGLKECVAMKVEFQDIKSTPGKIYIKLACNTTLDAQYDMKGQLIVPIEGKGKTSASLSEITSKVECELSDKTGKDGKLHIKVKSCTSKYDFKPNSKVHFDNLFPDNEVLAQSTKAVIETNSDVIVSELGPPILKSILDNIVKNIKIFLEKVPYEDLFL
ncbi:circadian clock-controlled protein daywake-like [Battus philenor]|uniref:circadian clock-controlled protein daywake-like n=1 Tax=Battus philenor TaxID=42288 RepID=UPI0035CFB2D5